MDVNAIAALLAAGWPIFAAIVCGFAVGIYVWANTKRDVSEALKLGEQNAKAIEGLTTKHEQHAERLARLEANQEQILEGINWMRARWWPRNRK